GIFLVTILPAPMTHPSPMVTPPQTVTFAASQQLFSMVIGLAYSKLEYFPSSRCCTFLSSGKSGCIGVAKVTFGPIMTLSPMCTGHTSRQVKLKFVPLNLPKYVLQP